ncbi:MAG: 50S ribosomal protein L22, partial [Candidatus Bathycorpusculaceae bacterium]
MESHINRNCAVQLHSWREIKVPKWGYSIGKEELDPERTAIASGREVRVSPKAAREICRAIRRMMLVQAKQYLRDVMSKKKAVPYRRFKKKAGHRRGMEKAYAGRYPVKAAKHILKVLEGAEANAENKGLDAERLRVIHASASAGMKIKRYTPRAHGRATPKFGHLCHIEIALEEKPEKGEEL